MAAADAEYYFLFRFCWYRCLQKVKVYEQTKFRRHISIDGWDLTASVFEKQMSAILEFYFRFWSQPLPVICMSSCITLPNFVQIRAPTAEIWRHFHFFFKTAAATAKYQFRRFRFRICWCHGLQKVKVYQQTKLRRYISIGGWDIITSVFEKQTSTILEFYFRFWSRPLSVICMSFCITLPNFSQIGAPTAKIWRHFIFQDGRHVSIDGWDITTSVFETQTSAILKIYFRFRFRPFAQNLDIILHQVT